MIKKALLIFLLLGCSLLLALTACVKYVHISAEVHLEASGYFEIENKDSYDWTDVDLTLNRYYTCTVSLIPAGGTCQMWDEDFAKPDGTRFNFSTTKPLTILIECQTPKGPGIYDWKWPN